MHALQDSFSHQGFFAGIGHFFAGTSPDKTHRNPGKALRAAEASYNALVKLNLKNGGGYIVPWSAIRDEVLAYLKAKEGSNEKAQRLTELNERIRESISQAKP